MHRGLSPAMENNNSALFSIELGAILQQIINSYFMNVASELNEDNLGGYNFQSLET